MVGSCAELGGIFKPRQAENEVITASSIGAGGRELMGSAASIRIGLRIAAVRWIKPSSLDRCREPSQINLDSAVARDIDDRERSVVRACGHGAAPREAQPAAADKNGGVLVRPESPPLQLLEELPHVRPNLDGGRLVPQGILPFARS